MKVVLAGLFFGFVSDIVLADFPWTTQQVEDSVEVWWNSVEG